MTNYYKTNRAINHLLITIVCIFLVACVLWCARPQTDAQPTVEINTYTLTATVTEYIAELDYVCAEDAEGNLWGFYDTDSWSVGDAVTLTMQGTGTHSDAVVGTQRDS